MYRRERNQRNRNEWSEEREYKQESRKLRRPGGEFLKDWETSTKGCCRDGLRRIKVGKRSAIFKKTVCGFVDFVGGSQMSRAL